MNVIVVFNIGFKKEKLENDKSSFFDVDGTLLSHSQYAVPLSTRRSLDKLKAKGIKCIIATGRHMYDLHNLPVKNIKFDAYITLNGQLCFDEQGNVISGNPIVGSDKKRIIQLFNEKSIPIMLIEKEKMYINFINHHVELAQKAISTELPDIGEYTDSEEIYQAIAYIEKEKETVISGQLPDCKITRWNDYAADIISGTGDKTSGILEYLNLNHIKKEETMAFGDGDNDIEMIKFAHIGVAMGNADNEVKENADFITDSIDHDGIEKALIKFKIID